ncbi:MAG: polyketide cyclase [Thalassobius sp.]|nr:polyketide cyclase [Thalassovita sp.]
MQKLKTEISIQASAQDVWKVLMDFENYPNWNPFIKSISGEKHVGCKLKVNIQPEGMSEQQFLPNVLKNEENREFRWLGKFLVKGLFDGEHYFKLREENGKVIFTHGENFSGLLVGILLKMIGAKTQAGFEQMNQALKEKVEKCSVADNSYHA